MKKIKVTITAEDRIGREESIVLMLEPSTVERLKKAANGVPSSYLREELSYLVEIGKEGRGSLSPFQCRKIEDFDDLIYHKFYNYTLSIN